MVWKIIYMHTPCFCLSPESSHTQKSAPTMLVSHCQFLSATWFSRKANTFSVLAVPFSPTLPFRQLYHFPYLFSLKTNYAQIIQTTTAEDHLTHSHQRSAAILYITKDSQTFFPLFSSSKSKRNTLFKPV